MAFGHLCVQRKPKQGIGILFLERLVGVVIRVHRSKDMTRGNQSSGRRIDSSRCSEPSPEFIPLRARGLEKSLKFQSLLRRIHRRVTRNREAVSELTTVATAQCVYQLGAVFARRPAPKVGRQMLRHTVRRPPIATSVCELRETREVDL